MNHLAQIAQKLPEYGLDAMLITSEPGERYAVGFHGEGTVLVTKQAVHYSTDARYIEAARAQISGAILSLVSNKRGHLHLASDFIRANRLERVGFESGYVSVDTLQRYQQELPCTLVPANALVTGLRAVKDAEELAALRRAQNITDAAFKEILNFIRPGLTEQEVAARLVYELLRRGAERVSFDPIVAAGPNGSKPHAVPGSTVIEQGMFLTMDFGCVWGGYCSDMTRTVAVGQPTQEMEEVYDTVLRAQLAGIAAAGAGVPGRDVDAAARAVIEQAGYGEYFTHSFGHSVGLEIHEDPSASARNPAPLPAGAVITAEPGIYIPGRMGVRIEDCMLLTPEGREVLTASPKDLIIL